MTNLDQLTLENICGGAVSERFHRALSAILKNMRDPNTPAKAKRTLTLEFNFSPHADRCGAGVAFSIKEKLAGDEAVEGNIYMAQGQSGELKAYPRDYRQEMLFAPSGPTV